MSTSAHTSSKVHRFEVHPAAGHVDPTGDALARSLAHADPDRAPSSVSHASIYLIEGELSEEQRTRVSNELLSDPLTQTVDEGAAEVSSDAVLVEVHPLPGVTDPAADSVQLAIKAMFDLDVSVLTGNRFDLHGVDATTARELVEQTCANPVVHAVHLEPFEPSEFPSGEARTFPVREIPLRGADGDSLERLSRESHLFLDRTEMIAIRDFYEALGREPRERLREARRARLRDAIVHEE